MLYLKPTIGWPVCNKINETRECDEMSVRTYEELDTAESRSPYKSMGNLGYTKRSAEKV